MPLRVLALVWLNKWLKTNGLIYNFHGIGKNGGDACHHVFLLKLFLEIFCR